MANPGLKPPMQEPIRKPSFEPVLLMAHFLAQPNYGDNKSRGLLHRKLNNLLHLILKQLKKLHRWLITLERERQFSRLLCALVVVEDLIHKELLLKVLALALSALLLRALTWQMQESHWSILRGSSSGCSPQLDKLLHITMGLVQCITQRASMIYMLKGMKIHLVLPRSSKGMPAFG
jgi:hypothetical protein